jgi:cell division protein FtsI/penicillin-binding protein 2
VATAFSRALGGSYADWYKRITTPNTSFVWLRRKVSGPALTQLSPLQDEGLIRLKEPLRHFEFASFGSQVIGATDIDNNGLNGVELFYNSELHGTDGYIVMQRDARGRRRPDIDLPQSRPEHGDGLVLTIDINMQTIVEEELKKGIDLTGAASGTVLAIDPRSGELLAIASWPTYNPNDLGSTRQEGVRVRAITDTYEPGSTMKIVTAAAALEEDVVRPDETISAEGGSWRFAGHIIRDDHQLGSITLREAMVHSSNIVMAKVSSRIAHPRFYKYVRDFGFGITSGIDLPGEARGEVKKPSEFRSGTQEFMAFGYQLAVTPLQLLCAYATIANGGVMMKPHLLKRRLDREGNVIEEIEPQEVRRVVSRTTADTLREMLVGVVEHGTGSEAKIPGMRVAGKTGTAQQIDGGEYSREKYNSSFVGYFPADEPRVVLLVLLDSPTNGYYGGAVAAPIFREIARRIAGVAAPIELPLLQASSGELPPVENVAAPARLRVPDLRGTEIDGARAIIERNGCRPLVEGTGPIVIAQRPAAGAPIDARGVVTVVVGNPADEGRVPDLRGLSVRRALNLLVAARLTPKVTGSGLVRVQIPPPGTPIGRGSTAVTLDCRP